MDMHDSAAKHGLIYVSVILISYLLGLIILLLHSVWKKHGELSFSDVYFELMPVPSDKVKKNKQKYNPPHVKVTLQMPDSGKI